MEDNETPSFFRKRSPPRKSKLTPGKSPYVSPPAVVFETPDADPGLGDKLRKAYDYIWSWWEKKAIVEAPPVTTSPRRKTPSPKGPSPPRAAARRAEELHYVVRNPSLFSLAQRGGSVDGRAENVLMETIETWPVTRYNVLKDVAEYVHGRLRTFGRRRIHLRDLFFDVHKIGEGSYGAVYVCCLREPDRDACHTFDVILKSGRSSALVTVFLAVKTVSVPAREFAASTASVYEPMRRGQWVGNINVMREILVGRFLNHLVSANVTPHFPFIYEALEVEPENTTAIMMELCHMDLKAFLRKVLPGIARPETRMELFRVVLIQLVHGLACAQARYNFRHNDFHIGNSMMTFILNTVYTYKIRDRYFAVPNFGMCWKLTDFGFSSSSVIFDVDDVVKSYLHGPVAEYVQPSADMVYHALETSDFLRMLGTVKHVLRDLGLLSELEFCRTLEVLANRLSSMQRDVRGSLKAFAEKNFSGVTEAAIIETTKEHGLTLEMFFQLAAPYEIDPSTIPPKEIIYDIDAPLFQKGLTGIESRFYTLDAAGRLRKK